MADHPIGHHPPYAIFDVDSHARLSTLPGSGRDIFFYCALLERKQDLLVRHIDDLREAVWAT